MSQYSPMDPTYKQLWLDALRSGDYTQGHSVLHQIQDGEDRWCCLGVLADVYARHNNIEPCWTDIGNNGIMGFQGDPAATTYLPLRVRDETRVFNNAVGGASPQLIAMNDQEGKSFGEIADWIEENL